MGLWHTKDEDGVAHAKSGSKLEKAAEQQAYNIRNLIKEENEFGRAFKDEYGFGMKRVKRALKETYNSHNFTILDLRVLDIVYHSGSSFSRVINVPYVQFCFLAREGNKRSGYRETTHVNDMDISALDLTPYRKYLARKASKIKKKQSD